MARKALFFIDEGAIKIVFGGSVKVLKPEDGGLPHNQAFLHKLFSDFSVYFVQEMASASKAEFDEFLEKAQQRGLPEAPEAKESRPAAAATPAAPKPPQRPRPPLPRANPLEAPRPHQAADLTWIKLREGAPTVVIDDLLTNEEVRDTPGVRKALVIESGLAVNLAELNPDDVRKSAILRRLIQSKAIVFTTADDAIRMKIEYDEQVANQPTPFNYGADIIDRDTGKAIASSVIGGRGRRGQEEDEEPQVDLHGAETVMVETGGDQEPNDTDLVSEDPALRDIYSSLPNAPAEAPEEEPERTVTLPPPRPRADLGDPNRPKGSLRRK